MSLLTLLLPLALANYTYDKRSLGDYQKLVFHSNATKAIQYDVTICFTELLALDKFPSVLVHPEGHGKR